jgi:hypothetical protein
MRRWMKTCAKKIRDKKDRRRVQCERALAALDARRSAGVGVNKAEIEKRQDVIQLIPRRARETGILTGGKSTAYILGATPFLLSGEDSNRTEPRADRSGAPL